jgi:thioredoxin 1
MKPVMQAVRDKYGDRVEVAFYDVRKNRAVGREYRIRLIPTQIFLRADGTEFFRHEGYFPLEEVEKVLQGMGVVPKDEG